MHTAIEGLLLAVLTFLVAWALNHWMNAQHASKTRTLPS